MDTQEVAPTSSSALLNEYWTRPQLAAEFHVTKRTVSRWLAHGTGPPFIKIGNRLLFKKASVAKWLIARESSAPASRTGSRGRRLRRS